MKMRKLKRKCFVVLLVIVVIIQDPFLSVAGELERRGYSLNKSGLMDSSSMELVEKEEIETIDQFQIQYYLNGGDNALTNPFLYREEDLPIVLSSPSRVGYNFAGWYTDSGFKQKIREIDEESIGHYTLYAKWTRCIDDYYNVQMYSYQNAATASHLDKKLKNCDYDFLKNIKIPGMPSTREDDVANNRITDTSQCPQGICFTDDYLLVSAYSAGRNEKLGCIHVFDRETGTYLATLGMKEKSHLGGLTFDGENVWVCHSDNNTLECIPYVFVKRIASHAPQSVVDCSTLFEEYHVSNSPSCITWYDGKIWVATHTKILNSRMIAYKVTRNGLRQVESYRIPDKVQGVTFDEKGKVYISTSYGRKNSSYIKVYASVEDLNDKPNQPMAKVEMPPCSEEIDLVGDELYVLFESASEKYFEGTDGKGNSISPIDQVLTLSKSSIFQ